MWRWLVHRRTLRLERAVQDEQARLARALHDNVAQDLAFIIGQSRRLAGELPGECGLADIEFAAASALDETRSMIDGLARSGPRPLGGPVERRARLLAGRAGLELDLDASDHIVVSADVEHGLLSILNEAISNAIRHAQPSRLEVGLSAHQDSIRLRISDDGRGFDPDSVELARAGGVGLLGMLGRATELGGQLSITSTPGRGTTIEVALPKDDGHPSGGAAHPSKGEAYPGPRRDPSTTRASGG